MPPGKFACGMRANTSKRSAVPDRLGRAVAGDARERDAVAGEALQEIDVGREASEVRARFRVMSTSPPQAYRCAHPELGNTFSMRARVALGASKDFRPE